METSFFFAIKAIRLYLSDWLIVRIMIHVRNAFYLIRMVMEHAFTTIIQNLHLDVIVPTFGL